MYEGIKEVGRFMRGLVSSNYRLGCYYEQFSSGWRASHKNRLEGMEVDARIHHRDEDGNDCSLVNWVFSFGKI